MSARWGLSAVAVVLAVTMAHTLGWWGLLAYVPVGLTLGFIDAEMERRHG